MDLLRLGEKNLFTPQRRRKWLILIAISSVSSYGAYKLHHLPSIATKRKRLTNILTSLLSVTELISDSTETISLVSRDFKKLPNSDSDQIPNTLKQISKIAKSNEFTKSLSNVSRALTIGISRGVYDVYDYSEPSVVDRVIDKALTESGSGFMSIVIGSFARNLVLGLYYYSNENENGVECDSSPRWVDLLCDEKCREVLADCIQRFTSTAVSVYLNKTIDINTYDQIFQGLTNPKHQDSVKDVLVSVCNGALKTLVKTSHDVFTSSSRTVIEEEGEDEFKSNAI